MSYSEDEAEADSGPEFVSNYHFVDDKDEPVSFSVLPIQWSESESPDGKNEQIFLHGTADNGLQKFYKQVTAWKFDISSNKPEISVLLKDNSWIKLQKPRKSFEDTIRTILITVHCLHYLKKNPEASGKNLWDHLSRVFSLYEVRPSQNDLVDHMTLITEAVEKDEALAKSKFLLTFVKEKPRKRKLSDEDLQGTAVSGFIVDDVDDAMDDGAEDDGSDEEDLFDSVCAFCDNGGDLLCCEGRCFRSFHQTVKSGEDSLCVSLGLSEDEVKAMKKKNFFCKNCESCRHQCFVCGKLGSSDKDSNPEVFRCASATCGHFYHPHCIAKLLHRDNEVAAEELRQKIAAGQSFTCPAHKCCVCKQLEDKHDPELQFAICRRCPKSYHRKCLPRKIAFEDKEEEGIIQRAWEDLLPNRILIYCLKHEIDDEIGTPVRDHIKFTDIEDKKPTVEEKKKLESETSRRKFLSKKRSLASEDSIWGRTALKSPKRADRPFSAKETESFRKIEKAPRGLDSSKKAKLSDMPRKAKSVSMEVDKSSTADESKSSLGDRLYASYLAKGSDRAKPGKQDTPDNKLKTSTDKPTTKKLISSLPALDADSERSILALMKESASSITLEEIIKKHKVPSTHAYSSKNVVDKNITVGKVEGAVEAVRTSLQKLDEGGSIEDAKAVCEPEILQQIVKWKNKLKVYLAPFLYGMRYTSYGRHFTKVEKLEEIVDKLHWYVRNGDTIVDFCCGSNDFSVLMKKKLDETGKKCSYKNYDLMQPKNDFNFEKRDWMTVQPNELPKGSQLIMGLNPPFGFEAALANKFVNKALEFNPKLLILIAPPETERLDKKDPPYDLIWEHDRFLSGKSFYLPGSVDVNDKQMEQWNVIPPLLNLWSRHDLTSTHIAIAQKHGHLSKRQESNVEENHNETPLLCHPTEEHGHPNDSSMLNDDLPVQNEPRELGSSSVVTEGQKVTSPCSTGDKEKESRESHGHKEQQSNETSKNQKHGQKEQQSNVTSKNQKHVHKEHQSYETLKNQKRGKKRGKGMSYKSPEDKQDSERLLVSEKYLGMPQPHLSPPNITDGRSSLERHRSKSLDMSFPSDVGIDNYQHFEPSQSNSLRQFGTTAYGGTQPLIHNDMGMYNMNNDEPYSSVLVPPSWSSGMSSDYGTRNLEEPFSAHMRDGADSLGYRPYISKAEERAARESDLRAQVYRYRHQDPKTNYLPGHVSGYGHVGSMPSMSYGHLGSSVEPSYRVNTSTIQRYTPRLDELNHTRMSPYGSETPMVSGNRTYDLRAPGPPAYRHNAMGFAPGPNPNLMGFAPGPNRPNSYQSSSGWLNE